MAKKGHTYFTFETESCRFVQVCIYNTLLPPGMKGSITRTHEKRSPSDTYSHVTEGELSQKWPTWFFLDKQTAR